MTVTKGKIILTPLALVFLVISLVIVYRYYKEAIPEPVLQTTTTQTTIMTTTTTLYIFTPKCNSNSDCEWQASNCCTENAGAKWECAKKGKFLEVCNNTYVLCPQVLSPKPTNPCICVNRECAV